MERRDMETERNGKGDEVATGDQRSVIDKH
jgi:hypothetical protein